MGFKLAKKIKCALSEQTYQNVYWDRFGSCFKKKSCYVVVNPKTKEEIKIPSTEHFGCQDAMIILDKNPTHKQIEEMKLLDVKYNS